MNTCAASHSKRSKLLFTVNDLSLLYVRLFFNEGYTDGMILQEQDQLAPFQAKTQMK